ncbi:MAG: hypothetical protein R1F54_05435 [Candidatus Zeuxoniibacter abyssi]|nr:MAG: hypothetical protein R1F54_05435 [Candidatus Persebacteraceae bacterium AB1(2)]
MRGDDKNKTDHMFFRPIGQVLMANLVRKLLDASSEKTEKSALSPMEKIDWDIRIISVAWTSILLLRRKKQLGNAK